MATIITISECGRVTIQVTGPGEGPCVEQPPVQCAGLAELSAKVDAIYRLVRFPKFMRVSVGTPVPEA